jgi:hypothetical protein
MVARIISIVLFLIWLVLVLVGKGGLVHLLLIAAVCVGAVDAVAVYRSRITVSDAERH